jgi:hypothetical protein
MRTRPGVRWAGRTMVALTVALMGVLPSSGIAQAARCESFFVSRTAGYQSVVAENLSCRAARRLLRESTKGRRGGEERWVHKGYRWRARSTPNVQATRIIGVRGDREVRGPLVVL